MLSEEQRRECIDEIIAFFQDERDEKIGVLAAEQILDMMMEKIVWIAYNKGINDAKSLLQDTFADININLDLLIKGK
ncbi:MAG: DUF2164 family protein [Candidatus Kerfeldbacteria bacterium]|nr:DUF2164 family protein [Candidatus Kerfeldbacteria bacterium]